MSISASHAYANHRRSTSSASTASKPPRSPSPPSQTFHPASILPRSVPTPALVESVAGGAHYSGARVSADIQAKHRRGSHDRRESHTEIKPEHFQVMNDIRELYCLRPTVELLERSWHRDAVFEDPLSKCKGFNEYAAQWFALPKLFSASETLSTRVMSSTHSPNRLVFAQTQKYTMRLFKRTKIIESVVIVDLDDNEKIVGLVDQWNGEDPPTRFGAHFLRVANAKMTPWLIRVPKA